MGDVQRAGGAHFDIVHLPAVGFQVGAGGGFQVGVLIAAGGQRVVEALKLQQQHRPVGVRIDRGRLCGDRQLVVAERVGGLAELEQRVGDRVRQILEVGEQLAAREEADVDVVEEDYLVEDTRHAVITAAAHGIKTFCLTLDRQADTYVRRIFGTRKVGHAGTLDPMATGVLVVGIERATKILGLISGTSKSYDATIRLGQSTSTDDAEGELLQSVSADAVTDIAIESAVAALRGDIEQTPSRVSAVKIGGKRAYQLAREGQEVELAARRGAKVVGLGGFTSIVGCGCAGGAGRPPRSALSGSAACATITGGAVILSSRLIRSLASATRSFEW